MFCFLFGKSISAEQRTIVGETVKERLRRLYGSHKSLGYKKARQQIYNFADCENDKMTLIYGGSTYDWKCGGSNMPSSTVVNAEHVVPQSFFNKKNPMVCDMHHIFASPSKVNNKRSNYPFAEMDFDECGEFCHDNACSSSRPANPAEYSCLSKDKKHWMPRAEDKGIVARAVLYFVTMYDDVAISRVGDLETFKAWNRMYPPTEREKARNEATNISQGNRNPYIDDYTLVDQAF